MDKALNGTFTNFPDLSERMKVWPSYPTARPSKDCPCGVLNILKGSFANTNEREKKQEQKRRRLFSIICGHLAATQLHRIVVRLYERL